MNKTAQVINKGFTLVELLVVIAIVAILAAVVAVVINPIELTKEGRDATRLADFASLQNAVNVYMQEKGATADPCNGASSPCTSDSSGGSSGNSNGTGWIKMDLSTGTVKLPRLPIDPLNSSTNLYYYKGQLSGGNPDYELNTNMESKKYKDDPATTPNAQDKDGRDGGNDPIRYEVGSSLYLI